MALGDPSKEGDHIGPLFDRIQFDRVQTMIQAGIDEGARLVVGGLGKPEGFETGWFVKPTLFADVDNAMRIAQEEIFAPFSSSSRSRTKPKPSQSPMTRHMGWRRTCRLGIRRVLNASPRNCGLAPFTSMAAHSTTALPSAGTRCQATDARAV